MINEGDVRNRAVMNVHKGMATVKLRLPEKGDYALNLYGEKDKDKDTTAELPNLLNYLIHVEEDNEAKPFPKLHENGLGKSYLGDRLGVKAESHPDGIIETDDRRVKLDFKIPSNLDLIAELTSSKLDPDGLGQCQKVENKKDSANCYLTLPEAGEYGLNCYVIDKDNPNQVHHVHTYLITSNQIDTTPIAHIPSSEEIGSAPVPVSIKGNTAVIAIPAGPNARTTELVRKNALDDVRADAVQVDRVGDDDVYTVDLGEDGEYKFGIFEYGENGMPKLVAEYAIFKEFSAENIARDDANVLTAEELQRLTEQRANTQTLLPDTPAIGWGPGEATALAGLRALTHQEPVIETDDGTVELRFAMENPVSIVQNLKNNDLEELVLKQQAMMRVEDNELVVNVRVPTKGEYALKLYSDDSTAQGELPNVCNYLIKSLKKSGKKKFPKFHEGGIGKGFFADHFNVKAVSHPGAKIQSELGVIGIDFTADADVEMVYEICNNDLDTHLSDCVKVKSDGCDRNIDLILPVDGEYALNVYARKKADTKQVYHVHTYFIESFQKDTQNLPPAGKPPKIQTIRVKADKAIIKVPAGKRARTTELLRKNHLMQMPEQVKVQYDNKIDIYEVKLPEIGEYRFDIFEEHGNGTLDHIKQYQIFRDESPDEGLTEEEKAARAAALAKGKTSVIYFLSI